MCLLSNLSFPVDQNLSLPPLSSSFLKCSVNSCPPDNICEYSPSGLPFENSSVIQSVVDSAKVLAEGDGIKTTLELVLDIKDTSCTYLPGDTIGILPDNPEDDVKYMLKRLNFTNEDDVIHIETLEGSKKKKPPYLPSLIHAKVLFQKCLDLRAVVKKGLLRPLIECTSEISEKRRLAELSSREGSELYNTLILQCRSSIIDILKAFPSCNPPLSLLLEHLPRLQPRPYSIASSPLENPRKIRIVFNVIFDVRNRRGVCSGWLYDITRPFHDLASRLSELSLDQKLPSVKVPIYFRKPTKFQIPEEPSIPLVMVGPGTGIAPFIGFLEHRRIQFNNLNLSEKPLSMLFFGCRFPGKDEIYREKLQMYDESGICQYFVCYSRTERSANDAKYVQDIIKQKEAVVVNQIISTEACVFICGNGLAMGKDVLDTLTDCFKNVLGISEEEAKSKVMDLEKNGRILKDLWF